MYLLSVLVLIAFATPVPVAQAARPRPSRTRCNLVRRSNSEIPDNTGLAAAPATTVLVAQPVVQPHQASQQTQAPQQSTGTYITYKFNQRLGTERYTITSRPDGITEAEAEIEVAGQPNLKSSTLVSSLRPVRFSEEVGGTKPVFGGLWAGQGEDSNAR